MDIGFDVRYDFTNMTFTYGEGVFGPNPELRYLDAIRSSLLNPDSSGPEIVYSIVMDIGKISDKEELVQKNLLYGAVMYNKGTLGEEPIRSQGHVHAISDSCGMSTPEVYEIHRGKAIIYMQESVQYDPIRCYAVEAKVGDVVIVPPGWGHATISADATQPLAFGAWCVRDFGFEYSDIRSKGGLAFFPILKDGKNIVWKHNQNYRKRDIELKKAREYTEFGIEYGKSIYQQYEEAKEKFDFVAHPEVYSWDEFIP